MASPELPSFDLVVATLGRVDELDRFLASVERQTHHRVTVHVVDQNGDDRLRPVLAVHPELDIAQLRSEPGLSRARNAALGRLSADLVAFPDDDCVYAPDLLERVARRFVADPDLDGLSGRAADRDGRSSASWKEDRATLTRGNLWNRAISFGIFLRRDVVARVGLFDERLGLGSGEPWSSGEEIDYLVRALDSGARIEYDPALAVEHVVREDDAASGLRDGASVGYLLRKHRYGPRMLARMLVRPLGGMLAEAARRDGTHARYHAATLRGRASAYVSAGRSAR
ncbi:MAG TPA: glycosyltransferase family A protein [Gaiellaceae bacterium]|nr:glycosyltransferase family A protein [Gaiellaceae bacterium]